MGASQEEGVDGNVVYFGIAGASEVEKGTKSMSQTFLEKARKNPHIFSS